ncbi:alpha-L-fucosidase [Streptomyces sp. LBL]|uniref:alpha-L-fucosidase n=1 Tax=Streptomyces sp. LBL TaxID=2940562 RepID=UPI00247414EE|nr:alpha-L-fucosidase [Streptomyces sp. LBL]MDH6622551.1 alpha-L-fucosidase [Streptomyces sp. LBL]
MSDGSPTSDGAWFAESRFGMFVHWGLYALAARHEWVKNRERLTDDDYQPYFDHFDPDLYDPEEWARLAQAAGMRYLVITTKHHDGFCLWDSTHTDYKVTNTPYGKDLIAPLVKAVRDRGMRVGFYHSLLDWHHPQFPVDGHHPQRDDEEFKAANADRDISKYADYLHAQVRELLTGYGTIDYLFFDFSYEGRPDTWDGKGPADWRSEELLAMVRQLQPGILVNDRLDIPGDFVTPEQYQPDEPLRSADGSRVPWEVCQTLNGSWGYDRDNHDDKSPDLLVRMLVDTVAKDGNLLLNVGPTGRGLIDARAERTVRVIGEWMRLHGRAVYGCGPSEFTAPPDCRYTQRGDRLYLHLFAWPFGHLQLPGLAGRVRYAQLLHDASEIAVHHIDEGQAPDTTRMPAPPSGTLTLRLPVQRPEVAVPVIELFLT